MERAGRTGFPAVVAAPRRLARDYETLPTSSEATIRWSMVTRMRRRLARPRAANRRWTSDVYCTNHPCSARRLAFERTPSAFTHVVSRPSRIAISLAFSSP
ncbi:hypothetical protein [Streptomyces sp. NPDC050287]|uniref:hypothetical protein n=1 Tax=Streptomyces sp. NPDC050287 TaxID=3365608 RepID=UPI0037BBE609